MSNHWKTPSVQMKEWPTDIGQREDKERIAKEIASYARNGDVIGAGSGSTSYLALKALGASGKDITIIPTSYEIEHYAIAFGLKVASIRHRKPDWCFDGADEVDPNGNMIKGRGGALLREKIVMRSAQTIFILIDHSKKVERLGAHFAIPVEVIPDALQAVEDDLVFLGAKKTVLRQGKGKDGPVITEHGNFILDVTFNDVIEDLAVQMANIVGIVETGLFIGFDPVIVTPDTRLEHRA